METQRIVRVGDIVTYEFSVQDYALDHAGPFAILNVASPVPAPSAAGPFRITAIDALEGNITLTPIDAPTFAEQMEKKNDALQGQTMPGLWSQDEEHNQGQQALKLMRELEQLKNYFSEVSAVHKAKVKTIELQLRALAHGAFPNETYDDDGSFNWLTATPPPRSKVDPANLPHPSELGGDDLARRAAAEAKCNLHLPKQEDCPPQYQSAMTDDLLADKPKRKPKGSAMTGKPGVKIERV